MAADSVRNTAAIAGRNKLGEKRFLTLAKSRVHATGLIVSR